MNSRSTVVTFVAVVAGALIALALIVAILPLLFHAVGILLGLTLSAVPVILAICALASCIWSNKQTNIKFLWIIIILLAPVLGPLLWFLWGKSNT